MRGKYLRFLVICFIGIIGISFTVINVRADPLPNGFSYTELIDYSSWIGDAPAIDQITPNNGSSISTNSTVISWNWFHYSEIGYGYFYDVQIELMNTNSIIYNQEFEYYNYSRDEVYPFEPYMYANTFNFTTNSYNIQYGTTIHLQFTLTYVNSSGYWSNVGLASVTTDYILYYVQPASILNLQYLPYMLVGLLGVVIIPIWFSRKNKEGENIEE